MTDISRLEISKRQALEARNRAGRFYQGMTDLDDPALVDEAWQAYRIVNGLYLVRWTALNMQKAARIAAESECTCTPRDDTCPACRRVIEQQQNDEIPF